MYSYLTVKIWVQTQNEVDMNIELDSIYQLLEEGRFTTQVPTLYIGGGPNNTVDVPDSFFMNVKFGQDRIAFGKEQYYLALSRTGFNVYKDELYNAYERGIKAHGLRPNQPSTKKEFVEKMNQWYDEVEKKSLTEAKKRKLI